MEIANEDIWEGMGSLLREIPYKRCSLCPHGEITHTHATIGGGDPT